MTTLSAAERRQLRRDAHHLKPVVLVGQHGLTAAVEAEIDRALHDHELIKIRYRGEDKSARNTALSAMAETLEADVVASIGHVVVLYRPNPENNERKK